MEKEMMTGNGLREIDIDDSNDPLLSTLRVASGLSGKGRREGETMTVLLPSEGLGRNDMKKCFDLLWPDAPFNFERYGNMDALNDEEDKGGVVAAKMNQGTKAALSKRKRGEKKMV